MQKQHNNHISFSSLFVFQTFTTFILFHEPYSERMIGHGYRTDIIAKIVIFLYIILHLLIKKYKTFSVLIYSYINTSGNWKNEKLCGNTTPAGRSVFTQFRVFPIFTSVDITVYQYGKMFYISFII